MKPLLFDFIDRRLPSWGWISAITFCAGFALTMIVHVVLLRNERSTLEAELNVLSDSASKHLQARQAKTEIIVISPRTADEGIALRILLHNWNQLYNTIEAPALSRYRLIQFDVDVASGQSVLEYEMDSFLETAALTHGLNGNARTDAKDTWQLERLETIGAVNDGRTGVVRGIWRQR